MRILSRYVLRAHVGPFLFALSALTGILLVNAVARQLENLAGKGLPASAFVDFILYSLPYILAETIPMSVLVAVLYVFSELSAENEIAALKASGVNLHRLTVPVLVAGIALAAFMVRFYDRILPESNHRLANLYIEVSRKSPTLQLQEQVLNPISTTAASGTARYYLQAATIDAATGWMDDVVIYDMSQPTIIRTIYADSGRMVFNRSRTNLLLDLFVGWINETNATTPTRFSRMYFGEERLSLTGVATEFEKAANSPRGEREMTLAMLAGQAQVHRKTLARLRTEVQQAQDTALKRTLTGAGIVRPFQGTLPPQRPGGVQRIAPQPRDIAVQVATGLLRQLKDEVAMEQHGLNRDTVEYYKKFALPFACIVFVLVGAPLALRFPRGGTGMVIAISLGIFSTYYVALMGGETLSDRGLISPFLAMWGVNILFLVLGLAGMTLIGSERSSTRVGTWDDLLGSLREAVLHPLAALRRSRRHPVRR